MAVRLIDRNVECLYLIEIEFFKLILNKKSVLDAHTFDSFGYFYDVTHPYVLINYSSLRFGTRN